MRFILNRLEPVRLYPEDLGSLIDNPEVPEADIAALGAELQLVVGVNPFEIFRFLIKLEEPDILEIVHHYSNIGLIFPLVEGGNPAPPAALSDNSGARLLDLVPLDLEGPESVGSEGRGASGGQNSNEFRVWGYLDVVNPGWDRFVVEDCVRGKLLPCVVPEADDSSACSAYKSGCPSKLEIVDKIIVALHAMGEELDGDGVRFLQPLSFEVRVQLDGLIPV